MTRIPIASPMLIGREREYVLDCLDREELSGNGSYVTRFERAFATFCGVRHAVAVANGTVALHLTLLALGVKPGDRVIVPALTYIATANAVAYCGATPVFADVRPDTWCLDPEDVERKLLADPAIVGVLPVHLYGVPADMAWLLGLADTFRVWVVEDAAEAHGATYAGRRVGSMGRAATFSFFGNKLLTTGEGGAVTTNDDDLAAKCRLLRGQGMSSDRRYYHPVLGYNYRLGNLQAAVGLAQLETYRAHAKFHAFAFEEYRAILGEKFQTQEVTPSASSANWMFSVLVPSGVDRDAIMAELEVRDIETRPLFPLPATMPMYSGSDPAATPVAVDLSARGVSLPTHGRLTKNDTAAIGLAFELAVMHNQKVSPCLA